MLTPAAHTLCGILTVLLLFVKNCGALECFYCRGLTFYDPNNCFEPNNERTFMQRCRRPDEVCEKKLVRIDGWTQKVERGCSANCEDRDFIWSEDFKVHCCKGDGCNGVSQVPASATLVFSLAIALCAARWLPQL